VSTVALETSVLVSVTALATVSARLAWRHVAALRGSRRRQHDLLYRLGWGEVTTNNYGFAPSSVASPERLQLQMYEELWQRFEKNGGARCDRLLEISCGRAGGLAHLKDRLPETEAVGLDFSRVAIAFCARRHARKGLGFAVGDACALPFADASFDVVIDVEASNRFGEGTALFREVARVLRPGGAFLFADSRGPRKVPRVSRALGEAGLDGDLHDITDHVLRACDEDASRRLRLIHELVPWSLRWILVRRAKRYAAIPGSRMYEKFRTHRRVYFMGCLRHVAPARGEVPVTAPAPPAAASRRSRARGRTRRRASSRAPRAPASRPRGRPGAAPAR
jgi:SAM-dependent methyltransferase